MTDDLVPLPEHLRFCGCRGAPSFHRTTCAAAIAFDAVPLTERAEYAPGRRFQAITWDFPLKVSGSINIEVALDPVAVIRRHQDEYDNFVMDRGFEEWEKPVQFICHLITEQCGDMSVWFGDRRTSRDYSHLEELSEYPRWTAADTEELHAQLAARPDPNQGAFEV